MRQFEPCPIVNPDDTVKIVVAMYLLAAVKAGTTEQVVAEFA
jgi:hypothetical protein